MFNENKKLRFQQSSFRKQLEDARGYKRNPKKIPEKKSEIFFSKLGLSSWKAKAAAGVSLGVLFYLVYIPNFLFVKHIKINGLPQQQTQIAEQAVIKFFNQSPLTAQKNIVFLSKNSLEQYILKNDRDVLHVQSIKKSFSRTLTINIEQRVNKYLLKLPQGNFIASNDGVIQTQTVVATSTTSTDASLLSMEINKSNEPIPDQQYMPEELLFMVDYLSTELNKDSKTAVQSFELGDLKNPSLTIVTKTGFKVIIDRKTNLQKTLGQLKQVLVDVTDGQIANIGYIDLQLPDRGFLCMRKTPCMQDRPLRTSQATSTPDIQQ